MMAGDRPSGSMFSGSNLVVSGGTYNINNTLVYSGEKEKYYERLLGNVVPNALHDSGHVFDPPKCHPGTRVKIIQAIMDWLAGADEDTRKKGVNWLTGGAGAGKSAIGRSICERCAQEGSLLGGFFFSWQDGTRNHSKFLASTIAFQACTIHPTIKEALSNAIEKDLLIFSKSLRTQLVSLVIEPLLSFYANGTHTLPCLIVIDGLDECVDKSGQRDILETIAYLITTYPDSPIRFLVCSRPEPNIKNVIHAVKMYETVFTIMLDDDYQSDQDIELYLSDNFNAIQQDHIFKHSLTDSWPGKDNLRKLVRKSSGQFIYASTVMKYIQSADDMPHRRLQVVLGLRPPHGDLPFAQLDALYTHMLTMMHDPPKATRVLAFVAMYPEMCVPVIARYLELENEEVEILLSKLAAIIRRRHHFCSDGFSLLHKSFEDFLFDQSRSKDLYENFFDRQTSTVIRSLQIFSEPNSGGCRFHSDLLHAGVVPFSRHAYVLNREKFFPSGNDSITRDLINALIKFPMEAFCNELFSHHKYGCAEVEFIVYFFKIISLFNEYNADLQDVYNDYLEVLSKSAIRHLPLDDRFDSLKCNFEFAASFIKAPRVFFDMLSDNSPWKVFCYIFDNHGRIVDNFGPLLTKDDRLGIFPRAALYCLQRLCDSNIAEGHGEAKQHLTASGIEKTAKSTRPWQCHELPVGLNYLDLLEYLPQILPLAGRYPPLINFCKTKEFVLMSLSLKSNRRHIRRVMDEYLERMEFEDDDTLANDAEEDSRGS